MMSRLPDIPLTAEANSFVEGIRPRLQEELSKVQRTPVGVLLWGPSPASLSLIAALRVSLRADLRQDGHAAFLSEELCDPNSPVSVRIQEIIQAQQFDLVVSIPSSAGSIAEAHDFAADRRVSSKMLVFLNRQHMRGYSSQSLEALSSILTCQLLYYESEEETMPIRTAIFREVQRIREMKYIVAGRY